MVAVFNFFAFIFVGFTLFSFMFEGGGGLLSTPLTASTTATATTLTVASTEGFLTLDRIVIGQEEMTYTGKTPTTFTGVARGTNGTDAAVHASGSTIYTKSASVLNTLAGFNVGEADGTIGTIQLVASLPGAFVNGFSQLTFGNFSFFTGSLVYLRYFFATLAAGAILWLAYLVLSAFGGLVRR